MSNRERTDRESGEPESTSQAQKAEREAKEPEGSSQLKMHRHSHLLIPVRTEGKGAPQPSKSSREPRKSSPGWL